MIIVRLPDYAPDLKHVLAKHLLKSKCIITYRRLLQSVVYPTSYVEKNSIENESIGVLKNTIFLTPPNK